MIWNFNRLGVHQNLRFRQAVHMVLDREAMVRELGGAHAFPAYGFRSHQVYRALDSSEAEKESSSHTEESLRAEVRQMLVETGYQGEPVRVLTYESPDNVVDLQWICQRAATYGIQLVPDIRDRYKFVEQQRMVEVDLVFVGLVGEEDEELSLYDTYTEEGNHFRNPLGPYWRAQVEQRLGELFHLQDRDARLQAFSDMEKWLAEEGVVHFLCHTFQTNHYHPNLLGAHMGAQGYVDFRKWWWKP